MANATEQVLLKLTPDELAAIDGARGDVPRTTWIKRLCADAVVATDKLAVAPPERPVEQPVVARTTSGATKPGGSGPLMMRRNPELIAQETGHRVGCGCAKCDALMFV